MKDLSELVIVFRGAGDIASGAALRLYNAGLRHLLLLERERPMAIRRRVCFSEAVYEGSSTVEGVTARLADNVDAVASVWQAGELAVLIDPEGKAVSALHADVLIDATLAKRNSGLSMNDAPLVIGTGPGFEAGKDVHCVVESKRGERLGRLIRSGCALPDSGRLEGKVDAGRLLRAPCAGIFTADRAIGQRIGAGQSVGTVDGQPVIAAIDGRLRGLLRSGMKVKEHAKLGDVEPRDEVDCGLCSDRSLAIGGALLEAITAFALES